MTDDQLPARAPVTSPENQAFWDATAEGRLLLKRCDRCEGVIWYPRDLCPDCGSLETSWFEASGRGTIYSWTVTRRGGPFSALGPYVLAYVQLEEGPRVMTNIVDADPDALAIDQPVTVVFHDTGEGSALPRFRPA
jgi:uncharacterized protein